MPLSTQVYKWMLVNCWGKPNKLWGRVPRRTTIPSRGGGNTSSRFMLQKPGLLALLITNKNLLGNQLHCGWKSWKEALKVNDWKTIPMKQRKRTPVGHQSFASLQILLRKTLSWKLYYYSDFIVFQKSSFSKTESLFFAGSVWPNRRDKPAFSTFSCLRQPESRNNSNSSMSR